MHQNHEQEEQQGLYCQQLYTEITLKKKFLSKNYKNPLLILANIFSSIKCIKWTAIGRKRFKEKQLNV